MAQSNAGEFKKISAQLSLNGHLVGKLIPWLWEIIVFRQNKGEIFVCSIKLNYSLSLL